MSLICIGDNVADYYQEKDKFYPGGSAYNVAVLTGRMGIKTAYIGTFGTDKPGRYMVDFLKNEGVDISHIKVRQGPNAFSEVKRINEKNKIVKVDKGVYKEFTLDDEDIKYTTKYDVLHTTLYSYTEDYLARFKKEGLTISFDYSFSRERKYLKKTAPYVDIAFFSAEGKKKNMLKKEMNDISELGPDIVVFTLGKKGVFVMIDGQFYYQPSPEVTVKDTLGAGDAFISSFLGQIISGNCGNYLKEKNLDKTKLINNLQKSVKKAANNCTYFGTIPEVE